MFRDLPVLCGWHFEHLNISATPVDFKAMISAKALAVSFPPLPILTFRLCARVVEVTSVPPPPRNISHLFITSQQSQAKWPSSPFRVLSFPVPQEIASEPADSSCAHSCSFIFASMRFWLLWQRLWQTDIHSVRPTNTLRHLCGWKSVWTLGGGGLCSGYPPDFSLNPDKHLTTSL